jgi:gamma-glutamyl hercynylcysteine S-oxide synthase
MKAILPKIVPYLLIAGATGGAILACTALILPGSNPNKPIFMGAAAIAMVYVVAQSISDRAWFMRRARTCRQKNPRQDNSLPSIRTTDEFVRKLRKPADPNDPQALVAQMLEQDRYALLLRRQVSANLSPAQFASALKVLGERMALVPDGDVELDEGGSSRIIAIERFFLDRYPVTNRQYYEFVAAGGYEQAALWDEAILPGVLEFIDRDGNPGPKFWKNGIFPAGLEKHPVVGVCWFEAAAYARWAGKRLPSDAEWVKAGAWPVRISSSSQVQRRYPWGDAMDRNRANLWGSGPGRTVPVDQYPGGASAGGICQLIGNVWQWTASPYRGASLPADQLPVAGLTLSSPLRSIRGGAFDTYFDRQASCQFQSGENPQNRRNNIGFRCAIGVRDLTLVQPGAEVQP